jgi:hypothetical protein
LDLPELPDTAETLRHAETAAITLPQPAVPARQSMPQQEPGSRPRRI